MFFHNMTFLLMIIQDKTVARMLGADETQIVSAVMKEMNYLGKKYIFFFIVFNPAIHRISYKWNDNM